MRAVVCHELTGPAGLRVDEMPEPVASAGEILIDVAAAGVNFPDLLITQGKYQFKAAPPFVPGGECAGTVRAVGAGVTDFAVGDRVAATMAFGAFAERVAANALGAAKLPDNVPFETGAAVLLAYGTTIHALVDRASLRAGETLLVLGASGGVGSAAIEIGKALGARVIAAARGPEKLAYCRERGADEVIDYAAEDLKERAKTLSNGGVDVTYDATGSAYSEAALRAMAWNGRHLVVGFAAGSIPSIPANLVLLKGCSLVGVFWGAFTQREPAHNRANVERVLRWIADGTIRPHIDAVIPFSRAAEALSRFEQRTVKGKLVLIP
ncbi:MAG: NADPH:quinone oxidoreductase family protein [Polyangiales bacterium]